MSGQIAPETVVVCVNAKSPPCFAPIRRIREGGIYRIEHAWVDDDDDAIVSLHGIIADTTGGGYLASRFRKIDDEVEESFRLMLRSLKTPPVPASSPAGFLVPRSVAAHIFGEG